MIDVPSAKNTRKSVAAVPAHAMDGEARHATNAARSHRAISVGTAFYLSCAGWPRTKKCATVENLWMTSAKPVDNLTTRIFLSAESARTGARGAVDAPFVITFA